MRHNSIRFIFLIDYKAPDHQSNCLVIAESLKKHAEDIIRDHNRAKEGSDSFEIKTSHGVTKVKISWDLEKLG